MKLKPYPEYKASGVPWLGEIPAHWDEKRAKYFFKEVDERSQTGAEEMLSVSHITGVTPRSQKNVTMFKAETNVGQKICQPEDLVINTMWAWMSALGVSKHAGIVSPSYGVYRPRSVDDHDAFYLDRLLRTEGYRSEYICRSTGIRSSRLRLYPDRFLSMPIMCPPSEEQRNMSRFLKAKENSIRKFIRNKRRLIGLLKEQKHNIINRAVTRGLDLNVKLKPSGVEWLGDIPEHWTVRKIKFTANMVVGGATPSSAQREFWDGDIVWITPQDVSRSEHITSSFRKITSAGLASCSSVMVPSGSVIFTSRAPVGNVALAEVPLCTNQGCKAVVPDKNMILGEYYFTLLKVMQPVFQRAANGTTFFEISTWSFENIKVPLPPLPQQKEILDYIRETTISLDQAISRAEREIELMTEYRARLISDVVTGKVDVRDIDVPQISEDELPTPDDEADLEDGLIEEEPPEEEIEDADE